MAAKMDLEALVNVPEEQLRAAVRAICVDDSDVHQRLAKYLRVIRDTAAAAAHAQSLASKKRRRDLGDFRVCERCHDAFFESENEKGVCLYHPGNLEVNWDCWPDHEEETHGPVYDDERIKEYPEGFTWDCCERTNGISKGCMRGRHWAKDDKRPRSDASEVSVGEDEEDKGGIHHDEEEEQEDEDDE